jgi:hypothetical protein
MSDDDEDDDIVVDPNAERLMAILDAAQDGFPINADDAKFALDNMLRGHDDVTAHEASDGLLLSYLKHLGGESVEVAQAYEQASKRVGFRYHDDW